jgi:hypothetical protein
MGLHGALNNVIFSIFIGANTNKILNENWQQFWEELRPSLEETFAAAFMQFSKEVFSRVPEKDVFLE